LVSYEEERSAFIAQQNATNWPLAEKSLKKANQLDPQNKLIVQYICVLYSFWKDPLTEENGRADEAICWLERLAELDPTDYNPNLSCATLLTMGARKLLPNYGRFPALPEPDLPSLRTKVGPLLDEASRHLTRAAEKLRSDQQRAGLQYFVDEIASMRIYLTDPEQAAREAYDKAMELYRKHSQPGGTAQTEAGITFTLTAEGIAEDIARPFPPNPWRIPLK